MSTKRPKVLIVGAGLGGLTLGAILQKSDIPYEIFERAPEIKPLGIQDEVVALGKNSDSIHVYNEKRDFQYTIDMSRQTELFGAEGYVFSRPAIHDLFYRQIPKERIHLGKKILSTKQNENGVRISCSDGTNYDGAILVGADGAYSAVRKNMYEELKNANKLPASDALPLPYCTVCLLGQTRPLDIEQFPDLAKKICQFISCVPDGEPYSWNTLTTEQNTICWMVIQYLDEDATKENSTTRDSEWGSEAAETMCEQVRDFPVVSGGNKILTIGDLIDLTPKELISKVSLEEKVFETWYNGRTALLGDACHKFNPAGGGGAMNAMHDAISLANNINALPFHPTVEGITSAFKSYQDERMAWVQETSETSKVFRVMASKSFAGKAIRFVAKHMPLWLQRRGTNRMSINRMQVAFLPRVEDTGSVRPAPQSSLNTKAPTDSALAI
ncbi:hypothetical protein BGX23_005548 [Mortierella sp. AD031]|nr:hypothetical protein BGX23_005548 [Mortierella sp. AD031]